MFNHSQLLLVVATYNEIETLPVLVERIRELSLDADILVIDDNSPDGTGRFCDRASQSDSRLSVIHRAGKLGLGSATILGMSYAIENGYTLVATMDADLSHDPAVLKLMLKKFEGNCAPDVVLGSRYVAGGLITGWPWYRKLSSYLVNVFSMYALGLHTRDNTSAYRMYSVSKLRELELDTISSTGYSYLEEILVHLSKTDAKFQEIPIQFQNREKGTSKVDFRELSSSLYQILRLSFKS